MVALLPETEPAVRYATRDLRRHYAEAPEDRRERGRAWYDAARREARKLSRETGYTLGQAAAVIAITSPDAQLSTNLDWARAILDGKRRALLDGTPRRFAGRYPKDQLPKVCRVLMDRHRPGRHATGPKVSAFYRAIMGATDDLVVDRWASFAAGGAKDRAPSPRERRTIERAYRQVASEAGENLRDFQAIVWEQVRETTPDTLGRVRALSDIV